MLFTGAAVVAQALQRPGQARQVRGGADLSEHTVGVDFLARRAASRREQHVPRPHDVVLIDFPRVIHNGDFGCLGGAEQG